MMSPGPRGSNKCITLVRRVLLSSSFLLFLLRFSPRFPSSLSFFLSFFRSLLARNPGSQATAHSQFPQFSLIGCASDARDPLRPRPSPLGRCTKAHAGEITLYAFSGAESRTRTRRVTMADRYVGNSGRALTSEGSRCLRAGFLDRAAKLAGSPFASGALTPLSFCRPLRENDESADDEHFASFVRDLFPLHCPIRTTITRWLLCRTRWRDRVNRLPLLIGRSEVLNACGALRHDPLQILRMA